MSFGHMSEFYEEMIIWRTDSGISLSANLEPEEERGLHWTLTILESSCLFQIEIILTLIARRH